MISVIGNSNDDPFKATSLYGEIAFKSGILKEVMNKRYAEEGIFGL